MSESARQPGQPLPGKETTTWGARQPDQRLADEFGVPDIYAKDGFVSPLLSEIARLRAELAAREQQLQELSERYARYDADCRNEWHRANKAEQQLQDAQEQANGWRACAEDANGVLFVKRAEEAERQLTNLREALEQAAERFRLIHTTDYPLGDPQTRLNNIRIWAHEGLNVLRKALAAAGDQQDNQ